MCTSAVVAAAAMQESPKRPIMPTAATTALMHVLSRVSAGFWQLSVTEGSLKPVIWL